jgi:D-beta-D-heptose 7-phosphate kinase/D-beta-D-heptose 1-phosphate adenosyltransferase
VIAPNNPTPRPARSKLLAAEVAVRWRQAQRQAGRRVVFTNGCFDLLHAGHAAFFQQARAMGDVLIVGLNTDASVRRNKGPSRPVTPEHERAEVLGALRAVDAVCLFDQDTPLELINALVPDVLVKGADWPLDRIVGREEVEAGGGRVERIPLTEGRSTTALIEAVRSFRTLGGGS